MYSAGLSSRSQDNWRTMRNNRRACATGMCGTVEVGSAGWCLLKEGGLGGSGTWLAVIGSIGGDGEGASRSAGRFIDRSNDWAGAAQSHHTHAGNFRDFRGLVAQAGLQGAGSLIGRGPPLPPSVSCDCQATLPKQVQAPSPKPESTGKPWASAKAAPN